MAPLVNGGRRWFCASAHNGQERRALLNVENQGFEGFLPLLRVRDRRSVREVPLFPGYLFVRFDPDQDPWRPLASTYGVRRLFGATPERPTPLPDEVVARVREQVTSESVVDEDRAAPVPVGALVRLVSGVYDDLTGICRWSSASRVEMLVTILGATRVVRVAREKVELV